MTDAVEFTGRLHPAVLHLPFGLLVALLLAELGCVRRGPGPLVRWPWVVTALSAAVLWSSPEMVSVLLKAGAPVNVRNKHGHTALMQLILYRSQNESEALEILRALLRAGANPNLADRQGETPLAAARRRKLKRLADALTR